MARMREPQSPGVQSLAGQLETRLSLSIDGIVDQRMADRRHVHSNLVRSPGFEPEEQLRMALKGFAYFVMRDRRFPLGSNRELQPVARIAADCALDRAARVARHTASQAEVLSRDFAPLHRRLHGQQALRALSDY